MISPEHVMHMYEHRKKAAGEHQARMTAVRDAYFGDMVVKVPELEDQSMAPMVANLVVQGIDHLAGRAASQVPNLIVPPLKPGFKQSEERANKRRNAMLGWWEGSRLDRKLERAAKHIVAYGMAPIVVRPDFEKEVPKYLLRDPLSTFPAPMEDEDDLCPEDVIFAYKRTMSWVREHYGAQAGVIDPGDKCKPDDLVVVLEYHGEDEYLLVACGMDQPAWSSIPRRCVELERVRNRVGETLVVVSQRITLDRVAGMFDQVLDAYGMQARLTSLYLDAVERSIYSDTYLVSRANETARIIDGPYDGRTGKLTVVSGGEIHNNSVNPGFATQGAINQLERAQRLTAGVPAEFGGESPGNVRTGRRGEAVFGNAVDIPVASVQHALADMLQEANKRGVMVAKEYFKGRHSFYVGWEGDKPKQADYSEADLESTDNYVSYSVAGADVAGLTIQVGQLVGTGLISTQTARVMHPFIDDAEAEKKRVDAEALERAANSAIEQGAASGTIPPADVARIVQLVREEGMKTYEALIQVQQETQARQAQQVPADSPAAQPGLAMPGMGAEAQAAPPAIGEAPQSLDNLTSLLRGLRMPQMQTPQERMM